MRLIIILVVIIPLFSFSQNCDDCNIDYRIISNNGCYTSIKQVDKNEIELYKSYCNEANYYKPSDFIKINNSDSLEKVLYKRYPLNFKKTDNGFEFIDLNDKRIKFQVIRMKDYKLNQDYEIRAIIKEYIIIYVSGYEWFQFELIDTKRFIQYSLPGEPVFINPELLYGYSGYGGDSQIKFIDTKNNKDVHLIFQESISNVGHSSNLSMGTLLEFNNTNCQDTLYLNIVNH